MKRKISLILVLALWLGMTAYAWAKPSDEMSDSERRNLAQFPALSVSTLLSGSFMEDFADYAVDQFPLRDAWRTVNTCLSCYLLGQSDTNGLYLHDGYIARMEYPMNTGSIQYATDRFQDLYQMYLKDTDCHIVFAPVPDKNYYLAQEAGMLQMDYESLFSGLREKLSWAEYVDLTDVLSIESYYRTDTHWRQECLLPVVQKLTDALDISCLSASAVEVVEMTDRFQGVYYGQLALPLESESLNCLTWDGWQDYTLYNHDNGTTGGLYNESKLTEKDPYEFFLSGNMAVQTVTNPHADNDRELVIFRDSFGSSVAPLLAASYAKVTLIDTRYISPAAIGQLVEFENQDVLFLYSTLVMNTSSALRK